MNINDRPISVSEVIEIIECYERLKGTDEVEQWLEELPTIKTKQIKYFDEDEKVWKIGSVIVDE